MTSSNFNLRGISTEMMTLLKKEAKTENISVNLVILKLVERGMGISHPIHRPIYHDLDHLASTWSDEDIKEFNKHTKDFEKIDKELW